MTATLALVRPRFASDLDPLASLWITRLCASITAACLQLNNGVYSEETRQMIGVEPREGKVSSIELRPLLKRRANELEQLPPKKSVLSRNVVLLGELLNLDGVQQSVLAFAALSERHPYLSDILENVRTTSIDAVAKLLSVALRVRDSDIRRAIRPDGPLLLSRLVSIDSKTRGYDLELVMPPNLRSALFSPASSLEKLMSSFLAPAPRPKLKANDFAHMKQETKLLVSYLANASSGLCNGINILIYGAPGTGKTEYVRWLATRLDKRLYQVRATDDCGEAINGQDRLAFFQVTQSFLQSSDAVILFDEVEDVFPVGMSAFGSLFSREPVAGKMFINRILESNPIPAIWVCNEVGHIDKAYLRRFDFSFEMSIPPVAVRRDILTKYLRGFSIRADTIKHLSHQEELSPAQIEKAAKVLKLSATKVTDRETTLRQVIDNSMALLGQPKNDSLGNLADGGYQLDYLNADCDLPALVAQLKRAPESAGALCFYGAPGTGKSALAHHLAQEMELPLHARRASDILGPYVGETEQKIAHMFRQAQQDGALLLLDEADSFLSERQSAKNSWEVTAVNEMLTQMERFDGLFICSTNLMQRLDQASLRRFTLKIKFDYLKPEQRWRLFLDQAQKNSLPQETKYRPALDQLNNLTPGDFATVRRQAKLMGVTLTADEVLTRLKHECRAKAGSSRPIGFVHAQ